MFLNLNINSYSRTENKYVFLNYSLKWKFSISPAGGNLNIYTIEYFQQSCFMQKEKLPKMSDNRNSSSCLLPFSYCDQKKQNEKTAGIIVSENITQHGTKLP